MSAPSAPAPSADDGIPLAERAAEAERLAHTWRTGRGLLGRLGSVDHKVIARRYVVTALVFFVLGGIEALLMRIQLGRPESGIVSPDLYSQLFTMHGTTMMFLFAVPIMEALGLWLVPLMVGTRNVAFPRLNACGYWVYLIGGVLLYSSFLLDTGPDTGWFSYVPLAGPDFSPGKRVDVWAQTVTFTEISALIGAIEIIATTFKQRAPGMSLSRMPLFVWAELVTAFMILFAMPIVAAATTTMLAMDRLVGTHFFNPAEGGDALLWQHLFWFFGHPEVYIIFLPATGIVSAILPVFCRRPMVGYTAVVAALVATGFLSFGLWVHHMFTTGLPQMGESFYTAASMTIAIPSGVQISCWLATIWAGRVRLATPMLFVLGFVALFVIGGLSGVQIAAIPIDAQVHDTYFIVAHFHYVLVGGAVFPLLGGIYYWFPKATGRMLSERMGRWNFWLLFAGVNLTFFPMHFLGLAGMPRRVYTYLAETGWGDLNLLATVGAVIIALGALLFVVNVAVSLRSGAVAPANPWGADTLEWATSSPPPAYNFVRIPIVDRRDPLWRDGPSLPGVVGMPLESRATLITTVLEAEPELVHEMPGPTLAPLFVALAAGVMFIVLIFTPWGLIIGGALALLPLLAWGYPRGRRRSLGEGRG